MDVYLALWLPDSGDHMDDADVVGVWLDAERAQRACQENQDGFSHWDERTTLAWETTSDYYPSLHPGWKAEASITGAYFVVKRPVR